MIGVFWAVLEGRLTQDKNKQKAKDICFLQVGDFPGFNRVLEKGDSIHVCLCIGKLSLVDGERTPPHSHTPSLMDGGWPHALHIQTRLRFRGFGTIILGRYFPELS